MKAKMSYKSKKIAIITAVVLVLIAAISVGTYFFVQGNDNAQAAYTENDNLAQTGNGESDTTETNNGSEGQTNPTDEQNDGNDDEQSQDDETPEPTMPGDTTTSGNDADQTVGDNDGDNNNAGTTTGTTNNGNDTDDNTDTEIPNEEYTQTDIIETEVERIEQQVRVGWSNIGLANAQMSTNILTNRPNLTLNKTSKIINSLGENDNAAREGSEIIYEISITNNSENIDATGVNVSDIVPTGTTLKENSISNNGTVENGRISWIVDVARNSTVTVSFTVIVDETATEISNVAVVDGKDTPETTNPIIETYKSSTSTSEVLEEGSEVTYTISVENKGNTTATTTVRDVVPEGTTLVAESLNGYENVSVVDNVITWNNVEVAGGETVELEFTVTINGFEGESIQISNTATVGDKDTNTDTIDVYNPVITLTKVADKAEVKEGDIITYTMTATNTGRVDGTAIISDAAPQGTTGLEGTITVNDKETEYTLAELEAGIPVEVAKNGGEATVSFQVQVKNNSGLTTPISNTAYLVDEDNPEDKTPTKEPTTTDVYGEIVFEENGGSKVEDITGVAGDKIEDTTMPETTRLGYDFGGWYDNAECEGNAQETLPEIMKAGTTTYYAKWTARTDTAYTVEHYLQDLDGEGYTLTETEPKTGTTGTEVTAEPKSYTGFTFDRSVEGTVQTGTIAGDGSLVLRLYYTRNSYKVTYAYEGTAPEGASELPEEATYKYGASVEVAGNATAPGYTFSGWDSDNVEIAENEFTMPAQDVVITGSFTLDPSLTLTKTALDEDRNPIQNGYVYKENGTNYMYYRLTVTNNGPEAVEEQIITDTLPYGMTYIDEGNTNISQETVEEQGKNKTRITWTIDGIEAYGSATVDIKVQIDERVFEGVDQVEDSEYNVISDITAISPENTDDEYQTTDTTGKKMSLFVRFASPVSGNSGYLYAGTTTAADSGMPTANNDLYVQKYNGTGRYTDGEIDGNLENAQLLANMLDDFYTANTDGTIASYVAGNRLPNEEDVKDFLEREYKITLDSNHTILWYKVSERAGEKARTRRYDITNKETYASYTEYVYMSACTYHLDGIIVDINSFNRIPDGSDIDVQNTAYVRTVDKSNWLNTEASADVTIYYNARPVNINLTTDRLTRLSETTDANNVTAKINAINAAPVGEQEETTGLESETEEFDAIGEIIEDDNKEESGTIGSSNATGQSESSEGDNATEQSESPEGDNTTGQLESPEEGNTTETDVEQTTPIVKEDMEENSEFTDESATSEDVVGVNSIPNEESDYEIKDEEATGSEAQENEKIEEDQSVQEEILEE